MRPDPSGGWHGLRTAGTCWAREHTSFCGTWPGREEVWKTFESGLGTCRPAVSPDGKLIAGCIDAQTYVWQADKGTTLWSARTGNEVGKGVSWQTAATFDGAGTRQVLLSSSGDVAQLWDWDARALIGEYRQAPELNLATVSPDGKWLATTNDVGEIRLWNLSLGDPQSLLHSAAGRITHTVEK